MVGTLPKVLNQVVKSNLLHTMYYYNTEKFYYLFIEKEVCTLITYLEKTFKSDICAIIEGNKLLFVTHASFHCDIIC